MPVQRETQKDRFNNSLGSARGALGAIEMGCASESGIGDGR